MWSDERDLIMDLFIDNKEEYPRKCPCCGKNSGHIFLYKNRDEDRFGSAWAWCSECKEYSHSRFEIPKWWQNLDLIEVDKLHACPDNLDVEREHIDNWVNNLQNK